MESEIYIHQNYRAIPRDLIKFICHCLFKLNFNTLQLSFTLGGALAGPTIALFIVGIFLPVGNWKGSAIGFVLGVGKDHRH